MQITSITTYIPNPSQAITFGSLAILVLAIVVAITFWVYKISYPEIEHGQTKKPQFGVFILTILAILGPEAIRITTDSMGTQDIFVTAIWLNTLGIVLAGHSFNSSFFFIAIPITLLRLVYPVMVYRYYRSMTSRTYVLIAGVLVELPMLLFGFPLLILLIVGLLIVRLLPVPKGSTSWPEEQSGV